MAESVKAKNRKLERLQTGLPGFDHISLGGLPKSRTTLVSGTAGSAKTIFACQFLAEGIKQFDQSGIFVTLEENPEDIKKNMRSFGWDINEWEKRRKWQFVDASFQVDDSAVILDNYDFGALLARIEHAVRKTGATRVCVDSLSAVFGRFPHKEIVRNEIFRISSALKSMGVTTVITAERSKEYGEIARYGVEEFVTDNVIVLRNLLEGEKRRRTIEILKLRGASHQKGEYPFTVSEDEALIVIPISHIELKQRSSDIRISSGISELDNMCGGGFFRDSVTLLSGATGTGKTLTVTQFIAHGAMSGERSLLFAFEESRDQLFRNASGWGVDFEALERKGLLKVICDYPECRGLEDHLVVIKREIEEFQPKRMAVDSLSALERVATIKGFREFIIGISSYIKHQEISGLFTATTPTLVGGTSVTETHISTMTDSIILLRYVEILGEMRRGLMILKMRGSRHDKDIREFSIDHKGMSIGKPFRNVSGILSGNPMQLDNAESDRLKGLFKEEVYRI